MNLVAEGIDVEVGGRRIVEGLSLVIEPGTLTVIVGPNGAGKSTLVRTLAGDAPPARGLVTLGARALREWSGPDLARVRAVLRQGGEPVFASTCLDVALLGRAPHNGGVETPRDHAIVHAALRSTGVEHLSSRLWATLSGGEKQRVQLARALAQVFEDEGTGVRLLFLDEPTSALDLTHQHACLRLAKRAASRGVGVVAVLHDLALAARYADRVVVLERGRMAACGAPAQVLTPALLAGVFGVGCRVALHPRTGRPLLTLGGPVRRRGCMPAWPREATAVRETEGTSSAVVEKPREVLATSRVAGAALHSTSR